MDDKDVIIAQLKEQIQALLKRIKELEEEIARLKKNSSNSSKPPSSDIVKPKKTVRKVSRKRRKRGGQFGHRKFERQPFKPEEIDETIEYELKDQDAVGLEPLDDWFIIQQIELPEKMFTIIATCKKQGRNVFEYIHQAIIALWTGQEYPTLST